MFEGERWRTIVDFPNYEISSYGRIRRKNSEEVRKVYVNHRGFTTVVLFKEHSSSRYVRHVNALTARAWLDKPLYSDMTQVWHNDGDLNNNRADNLRWDVRSRVLEWNEMHRTREPRYNTAKVLHVPTGRIYSNAFDCGITVGELESVVATHCEKWKNERRGFVKYQFVY